MFYCHWGFPGGSTIKNQSAMHKTQETRVQFLSRQDPLEEGMATHSSILAWGIQRTEEQSQTCGRKESDMTEETARHSTLLPLPPPMFKVENILQKKSGKFT